MYEVIYFGVDNCFIIRNVDYSDELARIDFLGRSEQLEHDAQVKIVKFIQLCIEMELKEIRDRDEGGEILGKESLINL